MKKILLGEKIAFAFLFVIFVIGIYLSNTNIIYFESVYVIEDGFIEYATALFLFCSSLLLFYRFIKFYLFKNALWKVGVLVAVILFLFASGEEISWGQRIFNVESSDYFLKNNAQGETNLHNMVVDGKKINKIIFSQLLTIILIIYLILTPFLYRKYKVIKNIANTLAVPIVKWHQTIAFISSTILVAFIASEKKWELYELAFSVIFFLIFLNPLNRTIYQRN